MNKKELVTDVAHILDKTQSEVDLILQTVISTIQTHLKLEGEVQLKGFGSFKSQIKPERWARNPKTGEKVLVPEKTVVSCKLSQNFLNT